MKRMICRLIEERDVKPTAALFKEAFSPSTGEVKKTRARVNNERRGAVVAVDGVTVVGFIFFAFHEEQKRPVLLIDRVAVKEDTRRKRVATRMLNWLIEYAEQFEYDFAYLLVNGGKVGAFNCYKQCGFSLNDSRKNTTALDEYDMLMLRMERPKVR
jgi:predicted N-acetyltransferase YhbS